MEQRQKPNSLAPGLQEARAWHSGRHNLRVAGVLWFAAEIERCLRQAEARTAAGGGDRQLQGLEPCRLRAPGRPLAPGAPALTRGNTGRGHRPPATSRREGRAGRRVTRSSAEPGGEGRRWQLARWEGARAGLAPCQPHGAGEDHSWPRKETRPRLYPAQSANTVRQVPYWT